MATDAGVISTAQIEELNAKSSIRKVNLDELQVDRSYQRDPSQAMVDKIAEDWDEVASELLLVSDRGERDATKGVRGGLWIVNGQHRSLGARKRNIKGLQARVIDLTHHDDPAAVEAIFRLRTNVRMGDKPLERFKAQLRAGDPESQAIVALLERYDTEVNENPNPETGINAVVAVEKLYRFDGTGGLLNETLAFIRDAFKTVGGKVASGPMMTAIAWFIIKHAEEIDRTRAIEKISLQGPAVVDRRARTIQSTMGGTLWMNYYRSMVDLYNERLSDKSKLEWRTRGASSFKGGPNTWGRGDNN